MSGTLAPGDLLAGKYRIEKILGRGGMGAVYLAENVDIGRRVAIKVLLPERAGDPTIMQRFRQEARAAAAIGHPAIIEVLDLGRTEDGAEFIVMEHLRGETLAACLERRPRLPAARALEIAVRVLEALEAAHARGIVHRDLKPDNIFLVLEPAPEIKILDFGISKLIGAAEQTVRTESGVVIGTPLYMAPEQAMGSRDLGSPADLYSLGALLHQMLAGQPPFVASSYAALILKVVQQPPPALDGLRGGLPAGLSGLVASLLAKDPDARPLAGELRARLLELAAALPPEEESEAVGLASTMAPAPSSPTPHPSTLQAELVSAQTAAPPSRARRVARLVAPLAIAAVAIAVGFQRLGADRAQAPAPDRGLVPRRPLDAAPSRPDAGARQEARAPDAVPPRVPAKVVKPGRRPEGRKKAPLAKPVEKKEPAPSLEDLVKGRNPLREQP